jgi:hypothetical protein
MQTPSGGEIWIRRTCGLRWCTSGYLHALKYWRTDRRSRLDMDFHRPAFFWVIAVSPAPLRPGATLWELRSWRCVFTGTAVLLYVVTPKRHRFSRMAGKKSRASLGSGNVPFKKLCGWSNPIDRKRLFRDTQTKPRRTSPAGVMKSAGTQREGGCGT